MIKAENIHKSYEGLDVLRGVSLNIKEGEIVSIVGSSGAGKSTLLQILGTLTQSDQGSLHINGKVIDDLNASNLSAFRNEEVGFIFQAHNLLPEFSALENVCIPSWIKGTSKKEAETKATELLKNLGLADRIHHKPMELSGGEQQRVAVARALINNPSVVFADEPSGNLDTTSAKALHELFFELRDKYKQTFVIVTHNRDLAEMSDRMLEMKDGIILDNDGDTSNLNQDESVPNQNDLNPNDSPSTGLNIISFLIPLVGLIIYITQKDKAPIKAEAVGKSALWGVGISVLLGIISVIISISMINSISY